MPLPKPTSLLVLFAGFLGAGTSAGAAEPAKVVLLGTGTPIPDPSSSGPCVAVVVNGHSYLFDAGPGVVRRAQAASGKFGIEALDATNLTHVFFTHLHSDHTLGYPDLLLTPWVVGRRQPLQVFGPKGIAAMTSHLMEAYGADIQVRTEGFEGLNKRTLEPVVHEIEGAGPVYKDENISVRALAVPHGSWPQAFGYAIEAGGRSIVISGDTALSESIAEACRQCDVLVHEVYSADRFDLVFGQRRGRYHANFHTSTKQLAELAAKSKPKLLVLYHQLYFGPQQEVDLVKEIRRTYHGIVVNGQDLTVY
ncbi:MAG: MBL fold metallo-hydrolase [Acidobacteria bacterium]|nr:MBL fold metallo-hydrolase [Acidobacteriota bacterium]